MVYHVFSRSIAGYKIFNTDIDFSRILEVMMYYKKEKPGIPFSRYTRLIEDRKTDYFKLHREKGNVVDIIAYCIMPTHVHFILKQIKERGISVFMNNVLNSYTRYFNTKHERKGPLWESRFKNVLVENDEYLLHLTRYVHLNPVTSMLVAEPELWPASSYREYLGIDTAKNRICEYDKLLEIDADEYKTFVNDRISYQKELHRIKTLMLE
ncbi:MAG: transposase [Endomicrobiales bacterium]|nr:transposase [Endomicrobiales bacterium]